MFNRDDSSRGGAKGSWWVDPKIGENCLVSSPNLEKNDPPKFPNPEKAPAKIFRSRGRVYTPIPSHGRAALDNRKKFDQKKITKYGQ